MGTKVTIGAARTYRVSEVTREDTFTFEGRLATTPAIEARSPLSGNIEKVREVPLDIHNSDGWIDIATECLRGKLVSITQDGVSEIWVGKITSWSQSGDGMLSITCTEDSSMVLSLEIPDEILRVGTYNGVEASFTNKPIPMVFGGTSADPIRVPGMVADRTELVYIICSGEIRGFGKIYKDNEEITEGFTLYSGTMSQPAFPGIAYIKFNSEIRDSADRWPEIIVEVIGLKVGSTEEESRNPARIIKAILTTGRSGPGNWGIGVAESDIDSTSFAQAITDCDSIGFKIDGIIGDKREARSWIDEIAKSCRGKFSKIAGKYTFKIDKASASVKAFDESNMKISHVGEGSSNNRTNRVKCEYRYRYGFSGGDLVGYCQRDDSDSQAEIGEVEDSLSLPLVGDHFTAGAIADYALHLAKYGEKSIAFQTMDFSGLTIGSVITVSYARAGFVSKKFRIFKFIPGTTDSRIYGQIEAESYDDAIFNLNPIGAVPADPVIDTKLHGPESALPPSGISNLALSTGHEKRRDGTIHAWIDGSFTKGRNFLIADIQISDDGGATFKSINTTTESSFRFGPVNPGTNYQVRVLATGSGGQAEPVSKSIVTSGATGPADVTGFSASQDSLDLRKVSFSWNPVSDSDLRFYEIRKGTEWNTSPIIGNQISGTKFDTFESSNGTYTYLIRAIDTSGNYSENASPFWITLVIFPSNVTNFQASQNGEKVLLTWSPVPDLDVIGYEIREGASWEAGQVIIDCWSDISVQLDAAFERKFIYHIKAKTRRKYYSEVAATSVITISNLLPKNYISTRDEIANPSGTHFQTEIGTPFWVFDNMPGVFDDYPHLTFDDFPGDNVLKLAKTGVSVTQSHDEFTTPTGTHSGTEFGPTNFTFDGTVGRFDDYTMGFDAFPNGTVLKLAQTDGKYPLNGTYTVQYDFPSLTGAQINVDWGSFSKPDSGLALLEFSTSNDGWNWTPYEVFSPCTKAFKSVRFKMDLSTSDPSQTPEVTRFLVEFAPPAYNPYYTTGYYVARYDLEAVITCDVAVDKFLFVLPPGVSADLQFRYSVDDITWSNWEPFSACRKTFRYLEFKMILATEDSSKTPEVTRFSVKIDVPDDDQKGTAVVPVEGMTISFPRPYKLKPALVVTAEGTDVKADYGSVTKDGFFVRNYKRSDGSPVGGQTINWISKGY